MRSVETSDNEEWALGSWQPVRGFVGSGVFVLDVNFVRAIGTLLEAGGAVGKRLDFMMQELNREANTLGSKSVDVEVTRVSLDLKLLIEQMREQIQNIE